MWILSKQEEQQFSYSGRALLPVFLRTCIINSCALCQWTKTVHMVTITKNLFLVHIPYFMSHLKLEVSVLKVHKKRGVIIWALINKDNDHKGEEKLSESSPIIFLCSSVPRCHFLLTVVYALKCLCACLCVWMVSVLSLGSQCFFLIWCPGDSTHDFVLESWFYKLQILLYNL